MGDAVFVTRLEGNGLRRMLSAGAQVLEANVEAVNALNVFPVPDGDTGTNMLLTLKAVVQAANDSPGSAISNVANAAAHGALLGARGNSGVIFSQFLRGVARTFEGHADADAGLLAAAFTEGGIATYRAVSNPVEGTMLTVIRRTAEAMQSASSSPDSDITCVLEAGLDAAQDAVAQTPSQLPVLKAAGVVDAGGQGFSLMLDGALRALRGEDVSAVMLEMDGAAGHVAPGFLDSIESEVYGFCTQFIIRGQGMDPDNLRERVSVMANSTVVIGDESLVRIHAHTQEPEALVELGKTWGIVDQVKIESMDAQHQEFHASHHDEQPSSPLASSPLGVVAVVQGSGLEAVFRSLGVEVIVTGGQTMNPSCQELLDAIDTLNADSVLILPNNANVLPAARQAAELARIPVHVVPTVTLPQGIAGMLAYSPEGSISDNAESMTNGALSILCGEVVTAVRDAQVDGSPVLSGQVMGLLEGKMVRAESSHHEALSSLVQAVAPEGGSLVTLYWGGDVSQDDANDAVESLQNAHPGTEVEAVHGGQPYYHYLVSIE
jgi:DAK2 domain fusion protein YloV